MRRMLPEQKDSWWALVDGAQPELDGPLAPLSSVLAQALVLRLLGDPADLEQEFERCRQMADDVEQRSFFMEGEASADLRRLLAVRGWELLHLAEKAREALRELREAGFDYDFDRRMVTRATGRRPRDLFREAIELILSEEAPDVLAGGDIPSERVRERIARYLRPFFPQALTDPSSSGVLYRTISNIRAAHRR